MSFMNFIFNLMILLGIWNLPEDLSNLKKKLYKIYFVFSVSYSCIFITLQIIKTVQIMTLHFDIAHLLDLCYLTIVDINIIVKTVSIYFQKKQILKIRKIFLSDLFSPSKQRDLDMEKKTETILL